MALSLGKFAGAFLFGFAADKYDFINILIIL
jgi:hypothetical protein